MQGAKARERKGRETATAVDPRLAAFARLLARHAARRDHKEELNRSTPNATSLNSAAGDRS
jgi:hypothetical protein